MCQPLCRWGCQLCQDEFKRSWCRVHGGISGLSDLLLKGIHYSSKMPHRIPLQFRLSVCAAFCHSTVQTGSRSTCASSPCSPAGMGSPGSDSPLCTGDSCEGESGGLMTTDLSERTLSLLLALCRSRLRSLEQKHSKYQMRQHLESANLHQGSSHIAGTIVT